MKHFVHSYLFLAMAIATLTAAGCGGVKPVPIGERIRNAGRQWDAAEAFSIKADKEKEREKWREQTRQENEQYDKALNAYRAIIKTEPTGNYAQRSLWQIAEIYKRRCEWDTVVESYNAILAISPSSYYADRAKSAIADMRTHRGLIEESQRKYQEYSALYARDNAQENYVLAAQALYDVAENYDKLGDYSEAITQYQRLVDEFPDYEKAPAALTKIGEIYYYRWYDYQGGWPTFHKVIEMYPDSYDATKAVRLLKETDRTLREIVECKAEIKRYRSIKAMDYGEDGRKLLPSKRYCIYYVDIVDECFQLIGQRWEDLRNYPSAIAAYRTLVDEQPHKECAAAGARYQIGRLYQLNGQLDQAIEAYQDLFDNNPDSKWRNEAIYRQAVCYRGIWEFTKAYQAFKEYMSLGRDTEYFREVEGIIGQFEMDQDGDGYKSYIEQEAGTSDQDPADYPAAKS